MIIINQNEKPGLLLPDLVFKLVPKEYNLISFIVEYSRLAGEF
jgi:hypothetical protein